MISLLIVIYIIFISLGLPDSLFGVAWPLMHLEFGLDVSFASIYSIIIGCVSGSISFLTGKLIRKFGTGNVTVVSILLTIIGIIGISFSNNIISVIGFAIILSSGGGAIDAGLNNFVSLHYKTIHMNWLHAFWGIGVTTSPLIMSLFLNEDVTSWRQGYKVIAIIQSIILFISLLKLKSWNKIEKDFRSNVINVDNKDEPKEKEKNFFQIISIKGVIFGILTLGFYCGMEFLLGTWGATYLVESYGLTPDVAAKWISLYYLGITGGRIVSGILSTKLKDKQLVILGSIVACIGIIWLILPLGKLSIIGLHIIGFGFGPIFPNVLHLVPERFGKKYSSDITGYHMGGAYAIGFATQLTFGFVASKTTFDMTPFVLIVYINLLLIVNLICTKRSKLNNVDN